MPFRCAPTIPADLRRCPAWTPRRTVSSAASWASRSATRSVRRSSSGEHDDVPDPVPAFELPWMGLPPGSTTDDTAMARNLWTSLIATGGELDTGDVLRRHLSWLATAPPDVGNLTRRVLSGWRDGEPDPARDYVARRGPEVSAGNGSVMYCAPLGLAYAYRSRGSTRCRPGVERADPCRRAVSHGVPGGDARRRGAREGQSPPNGPCGSRWLRRGTRGSRGARVPGGRRRHRTPDRRAGSGVRVLHGRGRVEGRRRGHAVRAGSARRRGARGRHRHERRGRRGAARRDARRRGATDHLARAACRISPRSRTRRGRWPVS